MKDRNAWRYGLDPRDPDYEDPPEGEPDFDDAPPEPCFDCDGPMHYIPPREP